MYTYTILLVAFIIIYNINENLNIISSLISNVDIYIIFTYCCSIQLLVRFARGGRYDLYEVKRALASLGYVSTYFLAIPLAITLVFNEIIIIHNIIGISVTPNPTLSKIIYISSAPILLLSILLSCLIIHGSVWSPVSIQIKLITDFFFLSIFFLLWAWSLDLINIYKLSSLFLFISVACINVIIPVNSKYNALNYMYNTIINNVGSLIHHIILYINIIVLIFWLLPKSTDFVDPNWFLILPLAFFIFYFFRRKMRDIVVRKRRFITDNLLFIIFIFLISLKNPISFEPGHYSFILLPVYSLMVGASPLADINSQYGIGILYFISSYFMWNPLVVSFKSMALLVNILNVKLYILLLYITWKITKIFYITCSILVLLIIFNRFTQYASPEDYPSTAALRFGLPYIILLSNLFGNIKSNYMKVSFVRAVCIAVASIWSAEAFIWTLACEFTIQLVYKSLHRFVYRSETAVRKPLTYFITISGIIVLAHIALYIDVFRRSGQSPDWRHYIEFLSVYGEGFGFSTPDVRTVFPLFYILFIFTIIFLINEIITRNISLHDAESVPIVIGMAVLGLLQMSYYAFRSHSNNIYHIMWPPSIIFLYWLSRIATEKPFKQWMARAGVDGILAFGLAFLAVTAGSGVATRDNSEFNKILSIIINKNIIYTSIYEELVPHVGIHTPSGEAEKLRVLVEAFYRDEDWGPAVIAEPELVASAFLGSGRRNMIALSYEPEDNLINVGRETARLSAQKVPLKSKIVISFRNISALRNQMVEILCKRGHLSLIERVDFLYLVRLEKLRRERESNSSDICRNPRQSYNKIE